MTSLTSLSNNQLSNNLLSKEIETISPLTPVQQGMLFHTLMQPQSGVYLQQYRYVMTMENLDVSAFEKAWQAVVERHQVLRSAFVHETQEQPLQVVFKQVKLPFRYLDWRDISQKQQQEKIEQLLAQEREQSLPFNQAPLMRVNLIQLDDNRYQFIRSYHHILMDAWCFSLIMVEFLQFYRHFTQGKTIQLAPAAQYQDYIAWLSKNSNQKVEKSFWQQKLAGFTEPTSLGISQRNRFANVNHQTLSKDIVCQLDAKYSAQLKTIANDYQVTLNTLLQGAWAQTLARYSQQENIVFGITVAGRSIDLSGIENMVGLFINTLPLKIEVQSEENLGHWLQALQQNNLSVRDFEQTSLALIQQWSDVEDQPLFNSIFVYENTPMDKALDLDKLEFSVEEAQNRSNLNYPLTVTVLPKDNLHLELTYRCSDFDEQSVTAMLAYFRQLLVNLCQLPSTQQIRLIDIEPSLNGSETHGADVAQLNTASASANLKTSALIGETAQPFALAPHLFTEVFTQLVKQQPNANAVTFGQETLSYAELNEQSNRLAHYLLSQYEIKPDTLVGLCMTPCVDMVVAILAILKSGAAYVPLDPNYPTARLQYMINDAELNVIVSQKALATHDIFVQAPDKLVAIDCAKFKQILAKIPFDIAPDVSIKADHLAYVIYTSGTTGQPKGVMVEHQQLSNFLTNVAKRYHITPQDKILQFSTINFDISIEECFGALCSGAELIIRDQDCVSDPVKFFAFCQQHEISVISLPTAFWHQLVSYPHQQIAQCLRLVIVGGEALQVNLVNHWFNNFNGPELVNTYGPTEATVTASGYHLNHSYDEEGEIPIGQANLNTELYILDKQLRQVPQGVIGELYIGGQSVARGYLNKAELTELSFVQSPFNTKQRLYRTGDLVRLNHNQQIEFNGRIDDQVKIRGYRIELAEIETVIQKQPNIKQCLVLAWQKENGDKALAAYFTAKEPQDIKVLRQQISEQLADYMIPAVIIELDELPLTGNGKVNKKALPNPESYSSTETINNYVAATNKHEQLVIDCWKAVLGIEQIGIHDNFFSLGGHSLLVIQVLAALRKRNIIIDATQLFKTPTPKTLAVAISELAVQNIKIQEVTGGLIPNNCEQITNEMLPLLTLEQQQIDSIVNKVPQGIDNIQDIYPLAPLQEGILFHHMLSPQNDPYIVKALLEISNGNIFERFIAGLNFVIQRHDILRTSILWRQLDKPVQLVNRKAVVSIEWLDFDDELSKTDHDIFQCMMDFHAQRCSETEVPVIDLEASPLLKLHVAKDPNTGKHAVMFIEHHIISDHISVDIIIKELTAFLTNNTDALKPSVPYRHFVSHALQHNHQDAQQYFSQQLGHIEHATLPYQLANVQGGAGDIAHYKFKLCNELAATIRTICKHHQSSSASFFHSAWALVIARASAKNEVVFGTVMSGRLQNIADADAMLGLFINTLPIKLNLAKLNASQLLAYTRENLQGLIPYEQSSLAMAQRCSKLSGEQPLFSALLNYRHSKAIGQSSNDGILAGIKLLNVTEPSNYPFTLSVDDYGDEFSLTLEIDKTLSCQQVHQELMTAITLMTEHLTNQNKASLLEQYLELQAQQAQKCAAAQSPDWVEPEQMIFTAPNKLPKSAPNKTSEKTEKDQPLTEHEKLLAEIWQKVLTIKFVSRFDNFFELGGHSLLIMQVITALQQRDIELSASQLFKTPVLKDLALEIGKTKNQQSTDIMVDPLTTMASIPFGTTKITPQMLPLVDLQQKEIEHIIEQISGGISNLQDIYPLAPLQEGILFHHRMDEKHDPYVMPAYLKIKGTHHFEQFIDGLNHIIERHDTLRTAILWRNLSQPVQVVYRKAELPVNWLTLDPTRDYLSQMQALDAKQQLTVNIEQAPLLNITVAHHVAEDEYVIRMLDHHIISDHVSMDIVQQELATIFAGNKTELPEPVQYRGFIAQLLSQQEQQSHKAKQFFGEQLHGFVEPSTPFSQGIKESNKESNKENHKESHSDDIIEQDTWLSKELSQEIRQQAKQLKLNPATLFHSAFAMVLAACSNKEDIVFGTVMSGRLQGVKGSESMMGMFINTLPVRINLTQVNAQELVQQTQQALLALIPYEQTPLSEIQKYSDLSAETPLFNTLFNYRHTARKTTDDTNSLSALKFIDPKERTNYPFAISIDDYGDDFLINTQVDHSLEIDRITPYLITALEQLMLALKDKTQQAIMQYSVVPNTEQQALLHLNLKQEEYPETACIYQLFEQQVQLSGDNTALIYENNSLSYNELDAKSNQLAHYLIQKGIKQNEYVALYMDRSFDMVIALWAVLKTGAAYLPIDVNLPEARIKTIVQDSQAKMLLTQQHLANQLTNIGTELATDILIIDNKDVQESVGNLPDQAIKRTTVQSSLSSAYLIYTSGSTGQPKGVVCSHQGLVNLMDWIQKQYQLTPQDKVLQKTPYNFDVSVWELVWPLITGASLVIARPEGHKDARYLTQIIQQESISHLHFVPSMLNVMLSDGDWPKCDSVKQVICIGEALSYELQQKFFAKQSQSKGNAELHNLYGPTEASIVVSYWQCQPDSSLNLVPIGKPIQNTQLLVLDNHLKLAPLGAEGELYIGGLGLAQGYLNKPELTAERFINHPFNQSLSQSFSQPFSQQGSEKLYRTGDLVRLLDDGNIDYIGRLDHQVKIRGLRIELGEIEFILNQHKEVNSAQLAVKLDQRDEPNLVAYIQWHDPLVDSESLINKLKHTLTSQLPSYMVPEHYLFIEQWPLSTSGKINKKLLPAPDFVVISKNVTAPATVEQSKLLSIWSELLMIPVDKISIDSNFFELGGHSILAMKLISAIEAEFNLSLSLNSLFRSPTIMTIAQQIEQEQTEQSDDLDFMAQLLNEIEEQ